MFQIPTEAFRRRVTVGVTEVAVIWVQLHHPTPILILTLLHPSR